jgi:hypothetical protein
VFSFRLAGKYMALVFDLLPLWPMHLETEGLKMFLDGFCSALEGFLHGEEEGSIVNIE